MKARFSTLAIAVASISSSVTERVQATRSGSPPKHAHRILQATDNISEKLKEEHANGIKSAKLLIAAQVDDGEEDAGFGINIPVVEAISSIDADTYFHLGDEGDGSTKSLNDVLGTGKTLADILVTDGSSTDADGSFAVLAVDPEKDEMHGFIEKQVSKPYKVSQAKGVKGGKAVVAEETDQAVVGSALVFRYFYKLMIFSLRNLFSLCSPYLLYFTHISFSWLTIQLTPFNIFAADTSTLGLLSLGKLRRREHLEATSRRSRPRTLSSFSRPRSRFNYQPRISLQATPGLWRIRYPNWRASPHRLLGIYREL